MARAGRIRIRRERPPRLRGLSINRLLPNILTILALAAGLTGIRFAIDGRWEAAVLAVIIAAVLDGLDGRVARLLNSTSRFGAQLDSLGDFVSFGVAPAMLIYLWVMNQADRLGWIVVLAFVICTGLRLARFNTELGATDLPPYAINYFTGVPAPVGALLALLPLIVSFQTAAAIAGHPILVGLWTLLIAALMISRVPTFSMKGTRVPHAHIVPVLLGVGLLAAAMVVAPWPTLSAICFVYIASIPFSLAQYRRLRREAIRLQEQEGGPPIDDGGMTIAPEHDDSEYDTR